MSTLAMRLRLCAVSLMLAVASSTTMAGTSDDVLALYRTFVEAQNRRDLTAVRSTLIDGSGFLWVSDGTAVWGADAMIERMKLFQRSEIWQVEPDLAKAVVVPLSADTAMLHIPLTLLIGAKSPGPDHLRFLVEILCQRSANGWRIAALLTTADKRQE